MPWGSRSWLRLRKETTFGTYNGAATAIWVPLIGDNAFSLRQQQSIGVIRSAHTGNRPWQRRTNRHTCTGRLTIPLFPSQAAALLGWAVTLTSHVLDSYTCDFFNGTRYRRYLGVKVAGLSLSSSAEGDEGRVGLAFDLVGQTTATITSGDLAEPADTDFPTDSYFVFQDLGSSGLKVGTTQTTFSAFNLSIKNILKPIFNSGAYASSILYGGRDVTFDFLPEYTATTLVEAYEGQTSLDCEATFTLGANTVKFDMHDVSYIESAEDQLPLAGEIRQAIRLAAHYSSTNDTDLTVTVT